MTLQNTADMLRQQVHNHHVSLDHSLLNWQSVTRLLDLLESPALDLEVDDHSITADANTLTITGRSTVLGTAAEVHLVFEEDAEHTIAGRLDMQLDTVALSVLTQFRLVSPDKLSPTSLPAFAFDHVHLTAQSKDGTLSMAVNTSAFTWVIPGAVNLSLKNVGFSFTRALATEGQPPTTDKSTDLQISGEMSLGSTSVVVSVQLPTHAMSVSNEWVLTLSAKQSLATGLSDLVTLFTGAPSALTLPPGLAELAAFSLEALQIKFDPIIPAVHAVSLTVLSTQPWELVPSIAVEDIGIKLLILQPSSATREISTELFGAIRVGARSKLAVNLVLPAGGEDWLISLTEPLSLSGLIELANLPGGLDPTALQLPPEWVRAAFWLNRFELSFNPTQKTIPLISVGLTSDTSWNILGNVSVAHPSLDLHITHPFKSGPDRTVTGGMNGVVSLDGVAFTVGASKADLSAGWQITGALQSEQTINLTAIVRHMLGSVALPDEVPDLTFSEMTLSVTPGSGALSLLGRATASWELPFGVPGLAVATVDLSLQRGPATGTGTQRVPGPVSCALKLTGEGPVTVVDGLDFTSLALRFDLVDRSSWTLSGTVASRLFDTDYTLTVSLDEQPTVRKLSLRAAATSTVMVDLGGIGALSGKSVTIDIAKAKQPQASTSPEATRLQAASPYTWDVTIVGGIKINQVFDFEGTLQLEKQADRAGLVFKAQHAEVAIPLPIPQQSTQFHFALGSLSILRMTTASGAPTWAFDATVQAWVTGLPESLQTLLATRTTGRFTADSDAMQISIDRVLQPLEITLPDVQTGSLTVALGTMALDAANLQLRVKGSEIALSMDFGVGLPDKLNHVFGTQADGTPSVHVFNTYQKGVADTITKCRLGIDTASGVSIQIISSPLEAIRLVMDGGNAWWHVDLGEFGKLRLLVPVISYTGDRFVARGGFEQLEPLKLPLLPLKLLLSAVGLEAASAALPRGIPLHELHVYDDQTQQFKFAEFLTTLETLGGFRLPNEVKDTLHLIENRLDALPDRFKSYLDIEIPKRFEFDISVTPDGGARGKVWVTGDTPLKLLYPTFGPLGPVLTGIELYSLTFGEVLSGSLMVMNLDLRLDSYDLLLLVAALSLPLDQLPILPTTRAWNRRLILKDLFMVIIYETAIPIPVPLFFDQLGLEYLGLEGLELQTHWGFPKPHVNMTDAARLFQDFENFFTKPDHLLDASTPPQGLDLQLTIGPNYLQLPTYLGGKTLGSKDEKLIISAYQNLAHLLNALKTLSLNELIQALPLEKRVGHEQVSFASMTLMVNWLITTPKEFREAQLSPLRRGR